MRRDVEVRLRVRVHVVIDLDRARRRRHRGGAVELGDRRDALQEQPELLHHGDLGPEHRKLLETVARSPGIARIFVNAAIKKALCREAGADRGWLRLIRPWWGHNYHFHIRLSCPAAQPDCQEQTAPGPGDGCGELDWWFTEEALHPKPGPPPRPLRISEMPAVCAALVQAR